MGLVSLATTSIKIPTKMHIIHIHNYNILCMHTSTKLEHNTAVSIQASDKLHKRKSSSSHFLRTHHIFKEENDYFDKVENLSLKRCDYVSILESRKPYILWSYRIITYTISPGIRDQMQAWKSVSLNREFTNWVLKGRGKVHFDFLSFFLYVTWGALLIWPRFHSQP